MVLFDLCRDHPGIILDDCVTAEAAADLTGYNSQHIRSLCFAGKPDTIRVGCSWLIKVKLIEGYLNEVVAEGDRRSGPQSSINSHSFEERASAH